MKRSRRARALLAILTMGLGIPVGAFAAPAVLAAPAATSLSLQTEATIAVGVHPSVAMRLTKRSGPVAGATIVISIDGRQSARVVTDANGSASTVVARDLAAGSYRIRATFSGTGLLAPSSAEKTLRVVPATFRIQTIPPIAGIALLSVDGSAPLATDDNGTIEIPVPRVGRYDLEIVLETAGDGRQLTFERWGDGRRELVRTMRLPIERPLGVALEVSYLTSLEFVDSAGIAVDPSRIESMLIASDHGDTVSAPQNGAHWLRANSIVRQGSDLASQPVEYRILEVVMRGTNVVNRGQLHFTAASANAKWAVPLLLFSLRVSAQDALFGIPTGSAIGLTYPDGRVEDVALDSNSTTTVPALPRGTYRAIVRNASGIALSSPLVLSRDLDVRVLVISYADIALLLALGVLLAVGLVLFGGRPIGLFGRRLLRRAGSGGMSLLATPLGRSARVIHAIGSRAGSAGNVAMSRTVRRRSPPPRHPPAAGAVSQVPPPVVAGVPRPTPHAHPPSKGTRPSLSPRASFPCPSCGSPLPPRARVCRVCSYRVRAS